MSLLLRAIFHEKVVLFCLSPRAGNTALSIIICFRGFEDTNSIKWKDSFCIKICKIQILCSKRMLVYHIARLLKIRKIVWATYLLRIDEVQRSILYLSKINMPDEYVSTKLRVAVNHVCFHLVTQFYTPLYTNVYWALFSSVCYNFPWLCCFSNIYLLHNLLHGNYIIVFLHPKVAK